MKLKEIIVDNFSYPLSASNYLYVDTNGVINAVAAVNFSEAGAYTPPSNYLVALSYLQDYVADYVANNATGGPGGTGTTYLFASESLSTYTNPTTGVKTISVQPSYISSTIKNSDWNELLNNANKKVLSTLISGWGFLLEDSDTTYDGDADTITLNTSTKKFSIKSLSSKLNESTNIQLTPQADNTVTIGISGTFDFAKLRTGGTTPGYVKANADGTLYVDPATSIGQSVALGDITIDTSTNHKNQFIVVNNNGTGLTYKTVTFEDTNTTYGVDSSNSLSAVDRPDSDGGSNFGVKTDWLCGQILTNLSTNVATPPSIAAGKSKVLMLSANAAGTASSYVWGNAGIDSVALGDITAAGTAGQFIVVNSDGTGLTYFDNPGWKTTDNDTRYKGDTTSSILVGSDNTFTTNSINFLKVNTEWLSGSTADKTGYNAISAAVSSALKVAGSSLSAAIYDVIDSIILPPDSTQTSIVINRDPTTHTFTFTGGGGSTTTINATYTDMAGTLKDSDSVTISGNGTNAINFHVVPAWLSGSEASGAITTVITSYLDGQGGIKFLSGLLSGNSNITINAAQDTNDKWKVTLNVTGGSHTYDLVINKGANTALEYTHDDTTNGNTYLRLIEDQTALTKIKIKGNNNISVSYNASSSSLFIEDKKYKMVVNGGSSSSSATDIVNPTILLTEGGTVINDKVCLSGGQYIDIKNTLDSNTNKIVFDVDANDLISSTFGLNSMTAGDTKALTVKKNSDGTFTYSFGTAGGGATGDGTSITGSTSLSVSESWLTGKIENYLIHTVPNGENDQVLKLIINGTTSSLQWATVTTGGADGNNWYTYGNANGDSSLTFIGTKNGSTTTGGGSNSTPSGNTTIAVNKSWLCSWLRDELDIYGEKVVGSSVDPMEAYLKSQYNNHYINNITVLSSQNGPEHPIRRHLQEFTEALPGYTFNQAVSGNGDGSNLTAYAYDIDREYYSDAIDGSSQGYRTIRQVVSNLLADTNNNKFSGFIKSEGNATAADSLYTTSASVHQNIINVSNYVPAYESQTIKYTIKVNPSWLSSSGQDGYNAISTAISSAFKTTNSLLSSTVYDVVAAIIQKDEVNQTSLVVSKDPTTHTITLGGGGGSTTTINATYTDMAAMLVDSDSTTISGNGTNKMNVNVKDAWLSASDGGYNAISATISSALKKPNSLLSSAVGDVIKSYLSTDITGADSGYVLKVNSTNTGFEWGTVNTTDTYYKYVPSTTLFSEINNTVNAMVFSTQTANSDISAAINPLWLRYSLADQDDVAAATIATNGPYQTLLETARTTHRLSTYMTNADTWVLSAADTPGHGVRHQILQAISKLPGMQVYNYDDGHGLTAFFYGTDPSYYKDISVMGYKTIRDVVTKLITHNQEAGGSRFSGFVKLSADATAADSIFTISATASNDSANSDNKIYPSEDISYTLSVNPSWISASTGDGYAAVRAALTGLLNYTSANATWRGFDNNSMKLTTDNQGNFSYGIDTLWFTTDSLDGYKAVSTAVSSWLRTKIADFAANKVLKVNSTGNGFIWGEASSDGKTEDNISTSGTTTTIGVKTDWLFNTLQIQRIDNQDYVGPSNAPVDPLVRSLMTTYQTDTIIDYNGVYVMSAHSTPDDAVRRDINHVIDSLPGYEVYHVTSTTTDNIPLTAYAYGLDRNYYSDMSHEGYRNIRDVVAHLFTNTSGNTYYSGFIKKEEDATKYDSLYTVSTPDPHGERPDRIYATESTAFSIQVNPWWLLDTLQTNIFKSFPDYTDNVSPVFSSMVRMNRHGLRGFDYDRYLNWSQDHGTVVGEYEGDPIIEWPYYGNDQFKSTTWTEAPQFYLSSYGGDHHSLLIFPTWFGQNMSAHLSNDSGLSCRSDKLTTTLQDNTIRQNYHYIHDFGINKTWLDNRISTLAINNVYYNNTLSGRIGTYTTTTTNNSNMTLNYQNGDFLTGTAVINDAYTRRILVTNIPVGQGLIARFDFGSNSAGAKIAFGTTSDIIISSDGKGTYYAGFVRYTDSTESGVKQVECIGVKKVMGARNLGGSYS